MVNASGGRDRGHAFEVPGRLTPIASASVKCGNGYSATTASEGAYSIPNVAPGSYSCTASANRYRPATRTVTVTSGQTTTADFNLARS